MTIEENNAEVISEVSATTNQKNKVLSELIDALWHDGCTYWIDDHEMTPGFEEKKRLNTILENFSMLPIELQFNIEEVISGHVKKIADKENTAMRRDGIIEDVEDIKELESIEGLDLTDIDDFADLDLD